MKIAVTATGKTLDAAVDPRFGRCATIIFVETDDMSFEAVDNGNSALGGGAGIQTAQMVAHKGAKAVLTGHCGPNAHQTLSAASVAIYVDCRGTIAEVVGLFKAGQLKPATGANAESHSGMGR